MNNLAVDAAAALQRILDYPVFPGNGLTVASLLVLIILFILVIVGERILRRHFITRILRRTKFDAAMQFTLTRVIGYLLLALGFYVSLQMVGINVSSLAILRSEEHTS